MTRSRQIISLEKGDGPEYDDTHSVSNYTYSTPSYSRRVEVKQSQFLGTFHKNYPVRITIDSDATHICATITKSFQIALQAGGQSPLTVVRETTLSMTRNGHNFSFEGLVV